MVCQGCSNRLRDTWSFCPFCGRDLKKESKSFLKVYEEWEERYQIKITHSTLNCYRAAKKYYGSIFDKPFCQIDVTDLQACIDTCPRGKRTKENMKALGSLLYHYALPRHLSDLNYALYLETGTNNKRGYRSFSREQIEIIRKSMGIVQYAEEIYALIYTGFRPTEFFGIRKEDYVYIEGTPCLIGGIKTNAGKRRIVTISPKIKQIIDERMKKPSQWLFPDRKGKKMNTKTFREKYFYPALDQMNIQPCPKQGDKSTYVPYSCRHTFSNLLKTVVGSDRDKADLMGHVDYSTTKRIYQTAEIACKKAITDAL